MKWERSYWSFSRLRDLGAHLASPREQTTGTCLMPGVDFQKRSSFVVPGGLDFLERSPATDSTADAAVTIYFVDYTGPDSPIPTMA